jgi:hypothetical protein
MGCLERDIVTVLLSLFENGRFYKTDMIMRYGFLECEWSDFAHDYMVLRANVQHRNIVSLRDSDSEAQPAPVLDDAVQSPPRVRRIPFFM